MLRWGRWVAVHVVGFRSPVLPRSKNVSKIVELRRPFSLVPVLGPTRTQPKMTNEHTDITIRHDPLKTLRELLTHNRPDINALESAYSACRTQHISYLTKSEFSRLVSSASARPEFVLRLCAVQVALGRRIPVSDRRWYMVAQLACCLRSLEKKCGVPLETLPPAPIESLAHAQVHYTKLAEHQSGVHRVYLDNLLRIYQRTSDSNVLAVVRDTISNVLKSLFSNPRFRFESNVSQTVWSIIASVRFDVPQTEALLHLLRGRLSSSSSEGSGTRILDPIESLRQAILDSSCAASVNQEARSILYDTRAWEWLRVLAGAHEPVSTGANTRLDVLVLLRQLEHGSESSAALLERCWDGWMAILGAEAASRSLPAVTVDRAILLAFLCLAARFQSTRVVSGSERLLTVYTSVVYEEDQIHMAQRGSLSVQLGAAYTCTGTSNLFGLAARLSAAGFHSSRLPAGYLAHVVELLVDYSPQLAWEVARQLLADLPVGLIASLALDCAKAGYLPGAVSLLRDPRIGFEERHRIALVCLRQLERQRGVLTRAAALHVCEALGPDLTRTPHDLRPVAVRMALNAGLVRLAGLMGAQWQLEPPLQGLLAARLVKARLSQLAFQVTDKPKPKPKWPSMVPNAEYRMKISTRTRRSHNLSYGEINATRLGNKLLIRSGAGLGGRAQLRATLATLARLLRGRGGTRDSSKRAPFRPDGVTLNIIVRALVRSTFCVSSSDLRALFDLLSRTGRCGRHATGNHFGTEAGHVLGGYASSALALAELVPLPEGAWAFVRYVRPLLKAFVFGLRLRRDQEAVKVVTRVLKTEDALWRKSGWNRAGGPNH